MTGPEHYRAAEKCLGSVDGDDSMSLALLAEAQVHATLALAAATATGLSDHPSVDWDEWRPVASRVTRPSD